MGSHKSKKMDITVQDLKARLDAGDKFVFLDVRETYEFAEFNLGATLIPLSNIPYAAYGELDKHKQDEIIIHCRSGARSGRAQTILQQLGFSNVRNVLGGVLAWQDAFGSK
jgi:rhodanese-related sulfurtransferase